MSFRRILSIILLIVIPLLEYTFSASHIVWIAEIRLIYLAALIMLLSGFNKTAIFFIVIGIGITDLLSFQKIAGLGAVAFFLALLLAHLLFMVTSLLSKENYLLRISVIFLLAVVLRYLLMSMFGLQSSQLEITAVISNLVALILMLAIYQSLKPPENAFKRK